MFLPALILLLYCACVVINSSSTSAVVLAFCSPNGSRAVVNVFSRRETDGIILRHLRSPSSVRSGVIPSTVRSSTRLCSSSGDDSLVVDENENDDGGKDNGGNKLERVRFRGRVAYDGTGFRGWQIQSKGRTCQGELEAALSRRFDRATIRVVGAGRTDAGVHARGQAFHFDLHPHEITNKPTDGDATDVHLFTAALQRSLNAILTRDIRVLRISPAPPPTPRTGARLPTAVHPWSAMYDASRKLYSYRLSLPPRAVTTDPVQRYTRVHVDARIDTERLARVLRHYEGTHDFRAFAGAVEANMKKLGLVEKDTVRTVYRVRLVDEGRGNYRIDFVLKGALYKMVRNMVGTALEVCRGRMEEGYMLEMLHRRADNGEGGQGTGKAFVRQDNKCKPASPEGLTLEMVYYDDGF